jgi:hypothetical protein
LQLDDWVLCRLYNKKNEWEKASAKEEAVDMTTSYSHSHSWGETRTPESEIVDNDPFPAFQDPVPKMTAPTGRTDGAGAAPRNSDLFVDLSFDDIQSMYSGLDMLPPPGEDFYSSLFASPRVNKGNQPAGAGGMAPF